MSVWLWLPVRLWLLRLLGHMRADL